MRTLIVCNDPAFPPVSGADLRNYRNAELAAEYGPVCLVSVRPQADPSKPLAPRIHTAALAIEGEARTSSIGWWRGAGENRISRSALTRLEALVQTFRPDSIVVEGIALFKLLRPLRPLASQLILDMHNVESDLAGQLQRNAWGPAAITAASGLRRLERKALSIVDRVWVCSGQDREKLNALAQHGAPIDVVPNGIPRAEDIPSVLPAQTTTANGFPVILFVGHLGYEPNIDAAMRLAGTILPGIRKALPDARLIIAGRSPQPKVEALSELPGVTLVESPGDLTPLLQSAHLTIVPLSSGGGTRIKLLEAMAWGVPVIATPLAAEGLDLIDGDEVLLSESDKGLTQAAIALCRDRDRLARQRMRAHEAVWARFGPEAIRNAMRRGFGLDDTAR
ncbi:glycosyltransferase family 4 protein [Mesorhizobium shangrilense]|uniref:Glycosyltransferase family 4 protein n=1 Tax=Mesorhizobium shangrilense TaxID=460060 RepID=A0ABV2DGW9_9HYPH